MIRIGSLGVVVLPMLLESCAASNDPENHAHEVSLKAASTIKRSGALSLSLVREIKHTSFGTWNSRLCRLSDFDGDGTPDVAFLPVMARDNDHTVSVYSVRRGELLRTIVPPTGYSSKPVVPRAIMNADDIEGDGKSDLIILDVEVGTDPDLAASLSAYDMGRPVPVWSCRLGGEPGLLAGSLAKIGDVNRDGIADIVVGVSPWMSSTTRGRIEMHSGRDGTLLSKAEGTEPPFKFGAEVARFADADADSLADIAVLAPFQGAWEREWNTADPLPRLEIRSSASGQLLRALAPTGGSTVGEVLMPSMFPRMLIGGRDVDGDGITDLLVRSLTYYDSVEVVSGANNKTISVVIEVAASLDDTFCYIGDSIDFADDLDNDGWRDLLVGHEHVGNHNGMHDGAVYLYSSKTRERLAAVIGDWNSEEELGAGVCWLGDTDGDGAPEFAASTARTLRIYSVQRH